MLACNAEILHLILAINIITMEGHFHTQQQHQSSPHCVHFQVRPLLVRNTSNKNKNMQESSTLHIRSGLGAFGALYCMQSVRS